MNEKENERFFAVSDDFVFLNKKEDKESESSES